MKIVVLLLLAVIQQISAADVFTVAANFEAGLQQARAEGKPIMLHISKKSNFVIVQSVDNSEPAISGYCYDKTKKAYTPRTCFITWNKKLLDVAGPNGSDYPNYYSNANQLIEGMKTALKKFQ